MVDFAGWDMPVQYRSILDEHRAVRTKAGLFDVSHMGEVTVRGAGALDFLQHLVTNDCRKLFPGRVLYTVMCQPDGGAVDDLLVHMVAQGDYLLCINASNTAKDFSWMQAQARGFDCEVKNVSADYAQLALQGPLAASIAQPLTPAPLAELKYYHFTHHPVAGVPCLIARTGYTGEDGFEFYCPANRGEELAEALLAAGAAHGLQLTGLGARDSLRLEAGFPLYGHELSETISPLAAGLSWVVKLDKGPFVGSEALATEHKAGSARRVVFFKTGDRRIVRAGALVLAQNGDSVGTVVSGTLSPTLNEAIGSALVASPATTAPLYTDIRGERLHLQVVKPPFVPLKKS